MFSSIRVRNFKGYADSGEVPLRSLTVLVGANNSGKSTLLQALLLLKQTAEDKGARDALVTSGPQVELGGFNDIVRGGREGHRRSLSVAVALSASRAESIQRFIKSTATDKHPVASAIDLTFSFDARNNRVKVARAKLSDRNRTLLEVDRRRREWTALKMPKSANRHSQIGFYNFFPVLQLGSRPRSRTLQSQITGFMSSLQFQAIAWEFMFDDLRHIGPLRRRVPWYGVPGTMPSSELGPGGENLLRVLASGETYGSRRKTLINLVAEWVTEHFGILTELNLLDVDDAGTIRALVGREASSPNVNVASMGEGVSQLLPLMAGVLMAGADDCLLIEQPEIHLHPAAQAHLGDLFIQAVADESARQLIIETHSEHLLLRIRRRIAEGRLDPDQVAILFVEKVRGVSKVRLLDLKENGHFGDWPKGFFAEGYNEALHLAEAASGL